MKEIGSFEEFEKILLKRKLSRDKILNFIKKITYVNLDTENSYLLELGDKSYELFIGKEPDKQIGMTHELIHGIYNLKGTDKAGKRLDELEGLIEKTAKEFYLKNTEFVDAVYLDLLSAQLEKDKNEVDKYNKVVELYNIETRRYNARQK